MKLKSASHCNSHDEVKGFLNSRQLILYFFGREPT